MGRGIRQTVFIEDENQRRLTFKKRRINLIKKAMQLSLISDCQISLQIFWEDWLEESGVKNYSFRPCLSTREEVDRVLKDFIL